MHRSPYILTFIVAALLTSTAWGQNRIIVKYKQVNQLDANKLFLQQSRLSKNTILKQQKGLDRIQVVTIKNNENIDDVLLDYQNNPNVEFAEREVIYSANLDVNDPYFSSSGSFNNNYDDLWGIKALYAQDIWDFEQGENAVVAVIDSGMDLTHPDLENHWTNTAELNGTAGVDDDDNGYIDDIYGYDFTNCYEYQEGGGCAIVNTKSGNVIDENGHGTHVAGTIAAAGNNGIGVIGVAPKARIMSLKGLNKQGSGSNFDLADAILYAADNGADVINMSWGGPGASNIIEDALEYAYDAGVVLVAAAGNDNADANGFSPARYDTTIAVASMTPNFTKSSFSNFGTNITVTAPGSNILSWHAIASPPFGVIGTNYTVSSGTSMAAPHVAGVATLLKSIKKDITPLEAQQIIENAADDIGEPGFDTLYGYGRVNAYQAAYGLLIDENQPPVFTGIEKIEYLDSEDVEITISVQDEQQSDDQITLTSSDLPKGMQFDEETKTLSWSKKSVEPTMHNITITADDGLETSEQTFSLTVIKTSDASVQSFFGDGAVAGCQSKNSSTGFLFLMMMYFLMTRTSRTNHEKNEVPGP